MCRISLETYKVNIMNNNTDDKLNTKSATETKIKVIHAL